MEAGYIGVYLWKAAVEKAGTADVEKVRAAWRAASASTAPEGKVTVDGANQHIVKTGPHRQDRRGRPDRHEYRNWPGCADPYLALCMGPTLTRPEGV